MRRALLALLLLGAAPVLLLFCAVPALLLFCAVPARAEPLYDLYAQGRYEDAARAGAAAHSAYGDAMAARAVLADAVLRDAPCMECLQRAEALARKAVAADPGLADGQIWLAVSLGYESRLTGAVRARWRDTPGQSKAALDAAVKDDPKNPYAVSALGGWHIEIVRGGGATAARLLYGATEGQAVNLFDRAVRLGPQNVAVHYQIALSLAGFDSDKYQARIGSELRAAIAATAETAYEKKIQARAAEMLALQKDPDAFALRLRKYQGFAD